MALFEKLVGTAKPKLPIHSFAGSLHLWAKGLVARADIVASFGLDAGDDADLDFLKNKYDGAANKTDFIATIEMLLICGEDEGRFGLDNKATFVAAVNQL